MSYILDALKRADADRERGHVPGLHSQTAGLATAGPSGHPLATRFAAAPRPALLAAVVLAVLGTTGALWWWSREAPDTVPVSGPQVLNAPAAASPPAAPAPTAPAPVEPAPPAPATATAPTTDTPPVHPAAPVLPILAPPTAPPAPAAVAPSTKPPARAGASAATATAAAVVPAVPAVEPAPPAPASASAPASAPGTSTAAVRRFADLPPETRAQLPAVSVSGSTYSQNPAHRMLIANGKVVQEGGEIAPGLTLETIGPRSSVLNHRGVRYSIGY